MYPISRNQPSDLTLEVIFKVKLADKVKNIWNFQKITKISNIHGRANNVIFLYRECVLWYSPTIRYAQKFRRILEKNSEMRKNAK